MKKKDFISSVPRYFLELMMILFLVLIVVFYSYKQRELELVVPILTMFSIAAIRLFPSVNQIVSGISHIRFGRPVVSLLYRDLKDKQIDNFDYSTESSEQVFQFSSLELKNINFSYPTRDYKVIDNLSLKIKNGDSIGLIGPSGSGKTTLLDILLGLIKVNSGEVLLNGNHLDNSLNLWTNQVAYIPQNIFIIDDSISRNIALGVPDNLVNHAKLNSAISQSKLRELIDQMPDGLNTLLGESGIQLSGGQRQRIALARAFYHNRDVLVMDEATSALDNLTEQLVMQEIHKTSSNKTIIMIAHRLSTVRKCDIIFYLEKGEVKAQGTYEELIKTSEGFKKIENK